MRFLLGWAALQPPGLPQQRLDCNDSKQCGVQQVGFLLITMALKSSGGAADEVVEFQWLSGRVGSACGKKLLVAYYQTRVLVLHVPPQQTF